MKLGNKNCDLFYAIKMNVGRTCAQGRVCIGTHKKAGLVLMGNMLTMPLISSNHYRRWSDCSHRPCDAQRINWARQYRDNFIQEEVLSTAFLTTVSLTESQSCASHLIAYVTSYYRST